MPFKDTHSLIFVLCIIFRLDDVTTESITSSVTGCKSKSSGLSKPAAPSIVHYKRRTSTPSSNLYVTSSVQTPPYSSKSNLPAQGMKLICFLKSVVFTSSYKPSLLLRKRISIFVFKFQLVSQYQSFQKGIIMDKFCNNMVYNTNVKTKTILKYMSQVQWILTQISPIVICIVSFLGAQAEFKRSAVLVEQGKCTFFKSLKCL